MDIFCRVARKRAFRRRTSAGSWFGEPVFQLKENIYVHDNNPYYNVNVYIHQHCTIQWCGARVKFPFIDSVVSERKLIKTDPVFDLNSNSPHVLFTGKRQRLQQSHVPVYTYMYIYSTRNVFYAGKMIILAMGFTTKSTQLFASIIISYYCTILFHRSFYSGVISGKV